MSGSILATVNIMDGRVRLRVDIGLRIETKLWTLLESFYRIHVLAACQSYYSRSSHELRLFSVRSVSMPSR